MRIQHPPMSSRLRAVVMCATFVALHSTIANAQLSPPIPDARLHLTLSYPAGGVPSSGWHSTMLDSHTSVATPRAAAGDSSSSGSNGAKKGFIIGAAVGFASRYLICDGASCRQTNLHRFGTAVIAAVVDGAVGALIGWKVSSK